MARLIDHHAEQHDLAAYPRNAGPRCETGPRCEHCGRPHGHTLRCLPDGRWLSPDGGWFSDDGAPAPWPDVVDYARVRTSRIIVGLYGRPVSDERDAAALEQPMERPMERRWLCRRCHMVTARDEHRRATKMRVLMRFALGDLFEGTYSI